MLQKGYCIVELTYLYKASGLKVNLLHWHKLIGIVKKTLLKILPTISFLPDLPNLTMRSYTKIILPLRENNLDILDSLLVKLFINFPLHVSYTGNVIQSMKYWLGKNTRQFASSATIILQETEVVLHFVAEGTFVLWKGHWPWTFLSLREIMCFLHVFSACIERFSYKHSQGAPIPS